MTGIELKTFFPSEMLSLCNLKLQQFSFLYIQTLHNDCSHIEDVHLLFCAHFIFFFTFLTGVDIFSTVMLRGCLVCVTCNSNSIHYFIFKLCIMIVHTLKTCTSHFFAHLINIFLFLTGVELRHFFLQRCIGGA